MPNNLRVPASSQEYIWVEVTAPSGTDPTIDVVSTSLVTDSNTPGAYAAAVWTTINGRYYAGHLKSGAETPGDYWLWVKVTDSPEVPVMRTRTPITIY